jgi:cellobiose phosphorylase
MSKQFPELLGIVPAPLGRLKHVETRDERRRLDALVKRCRKNLQAGLPPMDGLKKSQIEALSKRYSSFHDVTDDGFIVGGEHVIHKLGTPRPYLHLMTSNHPRNKDMFGSFWDQYGGGFCSVDAVLAGTITSHGDRNYVATAPKPEDFRGFVLRETRPEGNFRDEDWKPYFCWHAIPQTDPHDRRYDQYECHQGLGYSVVSAIRNQIESRILSFVPIDDAAEIWNISLRNLEDRDRVVDLFTWVKWGIDSYPGYYFDPRVVCGGEVHRDLNTLVAVNNDQNNKAPRSGFMMAGQKYKSFDLSAEAFTSGAAKYVLPYAAMRGKCSNSPGVQPYMGLVGAMHFSLRLPALGRASLSIIVGKTDAEATARRADLEALRTKYFRRKGAVQKEFRRLQGDWSEKVKAELVSTGDAEFDRFFNVWSKYQASCTARFVRALDKVGYRDVLQDLMSIAPFDPKFVKTEFLNALRYQFPDGRAVRQYERFKGGGHDERRYMDSPLWMVDTLVRYLRETGDFALLKRRVPYLRSKTSGTVYQHVMRGLMSCYKFRGQKGLCLVGHGDWNDALDGIGRGGQGVSVWLSMAVVYFSRELLTLAEHLGDKANARKLRTCIDTMTTQINENAWDGRYYVYGFDDKGRPIGSRHNTEGKIQLNVNTWALMSGVAAAAGRVGSVVRSLEKLDTPIGHLLLDPPYTARSKHVGRIADMAPGMFENGAVYTHGQSFFIAAMLKAGLGQKAYRAFKATMPSASVPDITTAPLHQQTNFAVGKAHPHFGQHLYTNFTGSLAWYRRTLEWMLGVVPDYDALTIAPCVPCWTEYRLVRRWRGGEFHITVKNPDGVETGVKEIRVDGRPVEGHRIPPMKGVHQVEILMG